MPTGELHPRRPTRGEQAKARILGTALVLFRKQGFEKTTMRDVAAEAGVALGAAYYYFRSKEGLVQAYYEALHEDYEQRVRLVLATEKDMRTRLGVMFHTSLDLLRDDRKLISGLFRGVGEVSPISPFGSETVLLRRRAIALFEEALCPNGQPRSDLTRLLAAALWAGHMAMILYLLHDESNEQERTRRLVDGMLDTFVPMLPMLPLLRPLLRNLINVLEEAGLLEPT